MSTTTYSDLVLSVWDSTRSTLENQGLRQPKAPKPHVMLRRGWWYLVDPPMGTWLQFAPITRDPR